jgi:hypothetical protein
VELHNGRLQGVVSSGSDIQRVYVSYFEAGSLAYYCSTNNNRICGGLRGMPCAHLQNLLTEAIKQYSLEEVIRFLKLPAERTQSEHDILAQATTLSNQPAGEVFARFLEYLQLLEHPSSNQPLHEMDWFIE